MTHHPCFLWTRNFHTRVHNSPTLLQSYQSRLTPYKDGIIIPLRVMTEYAQLRWFTYLVRMGDEIHSKMA
jgi:hypothetical protein